MLWEGTGDRSQRVVKVTVRLWSVVAPERVRDATTVMCVWGSHISDEVRRCRPWETDSGAP